MWSLGLRDLGTTILHLWSFDPSTWEPRSPLGIIKGEVYGVLHNYRKGLPLELAATPWTKAAYSPHSLYVEKSTITAHRTQHRDILTPLRPRYMLGSYPYAALSLTQKSSSHSSCGPYIL